MCRKTTLFLCLTFGGHVSVKVQEKCCFAPKDIKKNKRFVVRVVLFRIFMVSQLNNITYDKGNILHIDYHFIVQWSLPCWVWNLRSIETDLQQRYVRHHPTWGVGVGIRCCVLHRE